MEARTLQNRAQIGPRGSRTTKKSKNNIDPTKKGAACHSPPHFGGKCGQRGSKLASKMEQKSMQKSIKKLMHLGIDFCLDFNGFWEGRWKQLGIKIGAQIDIGVKAEKSTKR